MIIKNLLHGHFVLFLFCGITQGTQSGQVRPTRNVNFFEDSCNQKQKLYHFFVGGEVTLPYDQRTAQQDKSISIKCTVTGEAFVAWITPSGQNITADPQTHITNKLSVSQTGDEYTLKVDDVSAKDGGKYTCQGVNHEKFSHLKWTVSISTSTFMWATSCAQQNEHCDWLILGHVPAIKFKCIPTRIQLRSCCLRTSCAIFVCFCYILFKGKSKYITEHLTYGPSGN